MLRGIVENTVLRHGACLVCAGDDIFQRLAFPFGAGNQLVAIVNIGLVVQVVVVFQRFGRHAFGGKCVVGIGQIGKFKSHLASKRARQMAIGGRDPLVEDDSDKATVIALREIAEGLITPEVLARESEIEAEEELAASFETPIL